MSNAVWYWILPYIYIDSIDMLCVGVDAVITEVPMCRHGTLHEALLAQEFCQIVEGFVELLKNRLWK